MHATRGKLWLIMPALTFEARAALAQPTLAASSTSTGSRKHFKKNLLLLVAVSRCS